MKDEERVGMLKNSLTESPFAESHFFEQNYFNGVPDYFPSCTSLYLIPRSLLKNLHPLIFKFLMWWWWGGGIGGYEMPGMEAG